MSQNGSSAKRPVPSSIFDDFNFRFSNTYTVIETDKNSGSGAPLTNTARQPHKPQPRVTAGAGPPSRVAATPAPLSQLCTESHDDSSADGASLQLTAAFAAGLKQHDSKHRLRQLNQKSERQAATLMAYSRSRKSQVAPSFLAAPVAQGSTASSLPTQSQERLLAVGTGPYKPTIRPLPPPALGLAAGVVAGTMGEDTDVHTLTGREQATLLGTERKLNEELFEWWDCRAAMRLHTAFCAELDETLHTALEDSAKDMMAKEESYWLEALCGGQQGLHGTQVQVNPKHKKTALSALSNAGTGSEMDIMSKNNGLTPAGATNRGVIVPLKSLETLFRSLRAMLHERAKTLLHTYEERQWAASHAFNADAVEHVMLEDSKSSTGGSNSGGEEATASDSNADILVKSRQLAKQTNRAYLDRLYQTETELAKSALAAASGGADAAGASLLPACVSLPPDRMLQPLMVIEAATSVALMWKILEQVQTVVPGMDFALQLYRHYIMPHLYENYAAFDGVLPHQTGSLSDQMARFCALPLRTKTCLLANEAVTESKDDVKYLEFAMKKWALRSWRKSIADKKRREASRVACLGLLERAARRHALQVAFIVWRSETRESGHRKYMRGVERAYRAFLAGSALSTKIDYLPVNVASANNNTITYNNRTRVIATKLAEAAVNERRQGKTAKREGTKQKKSVPGSASVAASRAIGDQNVYLPPIPQPQQQQLKVDSGRRSTLMTSVARTDSALAPELISIDTSDAPALTAPAATTQTSTTTARLREMFWGQSEQSNGEVESDREVGGEDRESADAGTSEADAYTYRDSTSRQDARKTVDDDSVINVTSSMPRNGATGPFEEMLSRLRETEEVCTHLRGEIAVQAQMLRKLEQEKRGLQERNRTLEADLLSTVKEKLHYCNMVQEKQFCLQDRDRRITQLKSRLRAHRNRPWQRVVMRVMGELCCSSTQVAEVLDECRVRRDLRSDPNTNPTLAGGNMVPDNDGDGDVLFGELIDDGPSAREAEQERLFGELAPIVFSSTRQLPDALIILQDWANSGLDDLQSLDDLKGGALSVRFSSFSEEARSGVLLSRLLFYLALPRYLHRTATNGDDNNESGTDPKKPLGTKRLVGGDVAVDEFFGTDYPDRRRQLLEQRNVQLDTPFPVYSECFGDLLSMRPNERMTLLLQFATELVAGTDATTSDNLALKRQAVEEAVFAATDLTLPLSAGRVELQEVIDPHALAAGERASVVTLVALLYTRFAHPFNHKCRQTAAVERAAILHLLSGGTNPLPREGDDVYEGPNKATLEEELLAHLSDEDKSPWQLFKERCLPMFGSDAHPFLLRGNFWPSDAFDSPALANLLGELGMALNRSLQLHRWHVTLCCLVPVVTYSGLSRAVFTGPRASPAALRVGLEQEGEWEFPLHSAYLRVVCERRGIALGRAGSGGASRGETTPSADKQASLTSLERHVAAEKNYLMAALRVTSEDLLSLFLRRSTLSAELALPTMDLSGWRLLCGDIGLVGLELGEEDAYPLDLEIATAIYYEAMAALNETSEKPRFFTVSSEGVSEVGRKSYDAALQQKHDVTSPLSMSGPMPEPVPLSDAALEAVRRRTERLALEDSSMEDGSSRRINTRTAHSGNDLGGYPVTADGNPFTPLPVTHMDMTFAAFATAVALVANRLYPASRSEDGGKPVATSAAGAEESESDGEHPHLWLGDALRAFMRDYVLHTAAGNLLLDEPRAVIRRLQMGAATQEVIAIYTPALILVFNAYSKDVYGAAGLEKESLLTMLRDAMLTSTEISQYLVFELFQYCCVTRNAAEEEAAAKRRELDNKPRTVRVSEGGSGDGKPKRAARSVSILDPRTNAVSLSSGKRRDVQVLVMGGFIEFLCVLCHFKQPNPLIPIHQRFDQFIRRSVLRPLSHKVEGITSFLNQLKLTRAAQEANEDRSIDK